MKTKSKLIAVIARTPRGMPLAELLRRMERHGIARAGELAAKLNINTATAWRWLVGKRSMSRFASEAVRIALPLPEDATPPLRSRPAKSVH